MSDGFDTAAAPWCDNADRNLVVKRTSYIGLYYHKVAVKLVHHLFPPKASMVVNNTTDTV